MRATKTTVHLSLPRAAQWLDRWQIPPALPIAIAVLLVAAGISGVSRLRSAQLSAAAVPTPPLPIVIIATAPAAAAGPTAPAQVAYQVPAALPRYVVGFDSPNGHALGAIPAPDAGAIVARYGDAWLETTHDGAPIWVRASELGMGLGDVAPTAAAPPPQIIERPVYVASEPAAPAEAASTPAQTAPPPPQAPQASYPTLAPLEQNDVTQQWAREQWRAEHPAGR
jgi:hypothetical protein